VARWGDDDEHLVNGFGEVFETGGDAGEGELPTLTGPDGHAPELLAMYRLLEPLAAPLGARLNEVTLQSRGNWRVELGASTRVELGRGTPGELAARFNQFVATVKEVATRHERTVRDVEAADLRHGGGYALRLRGVSTVRVAADAPTGTPAARR
jgi:cell division protein FtsQ